MEITWFGHSCFRIKGKEATLVTDPCAENLGSAIAGLTANIITMSHQHTGHNNHSGIGGNPRTVSGPGEYEIADVFIIGMSTFHDSEQGSERKKNTIYLIEIDGFRVCHLGDLGHVLSPQQAEELGNVEVVLVPVGGVSTIDAKAALEVTRLLRPKIVIPMHYYAEATPNLNPVDDFLKEIGTREILPQPKLVVTRSNLPLEMQVTLLERSILK